MTTPFAIYEDPEEQDLMSPSEMFDGDTSFSSELSLAGADEALSSIELDHDHDDEPQPYKSSYTSRKSSTQPRRSSGATHYSLVSGIPSESSITSRPIAPAEDVSDARYSPRKDRPRFRNPESVRAMQMSSPPPLPAYEASRERLKGSYKLMTPSRSGRLETPVSKKSGSRRNSVRETHSPRPTPTPQQAPLVLLHVTILPPQVPFSSDLMVKIMPEWLVENYKVLDEKLQDIILMRRGLLIPHPRDEYDLLEERILESLELKTPRLLKCGHFVPPEADSDDEIDDDQSSITGDSTGRGSRMSGGTLTLEHEHNLDTDEAGTCMDCHRDVKRPGKGVGAGRRRWDIKIYAANGLMREAAWSACWNDMERCDVEISPWIPDDVRKTFERRVQEEQEAAQRKQQYAAELQLQIQQAASKQSIIEEEAAERKKLEEAELQKSYEAAAAALERSKEEKAAERKKFEETMAERIEEAKLSIRSELEAPVAERLRVLEEAIRQQTTTSAAESTVSSTPIAVQKRRTSRVVSGQVPTTNIPLGVLLKNYVLVLLRDQRNWIIVLLGAAVVYLSLNMDPSSRTQLYPAQMIDETALLDHVSTIAVTTTATATTTSTATAFSTHTVTQIVAATSAAETVIPNLLLVEEEVVTVKEEGITSAQEHTGLAVDDALVDYIEFEVEPAISNFEQPQAPVTSDMSDSGFTTVTHSFRPHLPVCPALDS